MGEVIDLKSQPARIEDDHEFIVDLCRYSENILSQEAVRKKYRHIDDATWAKLGDDDVLVEKIEIQKTKRLRDGSSKREKAQLLVIKAPDVLSAIMLDDRANPRHRIDASKALDAFAANPAGNTPASDRFIISINLGGDILRFNKSVAPDPNDIDPFNDIDATPQSAIAATKRGGGDGEPL